MIIKSYILEQNISNLNNYKIVLFYGENLGLKHEFKNKLKDENQPNEILNFVQDEIFKNKERFMSGIKNQSLFSTKKVILISQANEKILEILIEVESYLESDKIYVFSENLDKKSKLRSHFEKGGNIGIVPCYSDNEITIKNILISKLKDFKGVNNEVLNLIIKSTNLDRNKVNNEIEKIESLFTNKIIDPDKIESLLNLKTNEDFNKLRDEALNGNKINTNRLLADTVFETENNIYFLNAINQRINRLKEIDGMKNNNESIEVSISKLRPPIFWKDKPKIIEQSKKWNARKIKEALEKTYNIELKIKSNSYVNKELLIKKLLVDLCATASSS